MASLNAKVVALENNFANLNARVLSITPNNLIYAALGSFVKYGCKVTEGSSSPLDMVVRLQGQAAGDSGNLNSDVSSNPTRPFQYPNIASIKGGAFFSNDTTATVATAPSAGTARYDIAYVFAGKEGAGFGIAEGTPSAAVLADHTANGLQTTQYNTSSPNFDPSLPIGALPVARIYVAPSVTAIADADIADLRSYNDFSTSIVTPAFEVPPELGSITPNVVNATTLNATTINGGGFTLSGGVIDHQTTDASSLTFSGGSSVSSGLNITVYGGSHASRAKDLEIKTNSTVIVDYDFSDLELTLHHTTRILETINSSVVSGENAIFAKTNNRPAVRFDGATLNTTVGIGPSDELEFYRNDGTTKNLSIDNPTGDTTVTGAVISTGANMAINSTGLMLNYSGNSTSVRYGGGDTGQVLLYGGSTLSATFGANSITLAPAVTLSSTLELSDTSYFIGSATNGFRFNNNADDSNNMLISDAGNVEIRGTLIAGSTTDTAETTLHVVGPDGTIATASQFSNSVAFFENNDIHTLLEIVGPNATSVAAGLMLVQQGDSDYGFVGSVPSAEKIRLGYGTSAITETNAGVTVDKVGRVTIYSTLASDYASSVVLKNDAAGTSYTQLGIEWWDRSTTLNAIAYGTRQNIAGNWNGAFFLDLNNTDVPETTPANLTTYFQIDAQSDYVHFPVAGTKLAIGKSGAITYELEVISSGSSDLLLGSSGGASATLLLDGNSNGDGAGNDYAYIRHETTTGDLNIINLQSANITFYAAGSAAGNVGLQIDGSQDVSIPNGNLTVGDGSDTSTNIQIDASATGSPYLQFEQAGTAKAFLQYQDSGDILAINSDGEVRILPNNVASAIFDTSGDLTLAGDLTLSAGNIDLTTTATTTDALSITANSLQTASALDIISTSTHTGTRDIVSIRNTGAASANACPLKIQQAADNECMRFDHDGAGPFIDYQGTASANTTDPISTHGTTGALQGFLQIEVNTVKRWIPFYDDPSA